MGRIEEIKKETKISDKIKHTLEGRYALSEHGTTHVSTLLKNKIHSGSTKIRWYIEANARKRRNVLFKNNQCQLYKELGGKSQSDYTSSPNADEAKEFWGGI